MWASDSVMSARFVLPPCPVNRTRRPESRASSGFSSSALTKPKIVMLAPVPMPIDRMATIANVGLRQSWRAPYLMSPNTFVMRSLRPERDDRLESSGSPRGKLGCQHSDHEQTRRREEERCWISRRDAVEQSGQQSTQHVRARKTN